MRFFSCFVEKFVKEKIKMPVFVSYAFSMRWFFNAVGRSGFSGFQWILDDFAVAIDKVEHKTLETSAPPCP